MSRKKRHQSWSTFIEELGFRVRLYERAKGASVYYSFKLDGKKVQKSTGTSDREEAEAYARAVITELVRTRLTGLEDPESPTLGELFRGYFGDRQLSESWSKQAAMRRELFEEAWGTDLAVLDLSQAHVDAYARARMAGELSPFEAGEEGKDPVEVRAGTVDGDFRWLNSVFNWARKKKVEGRRLLRENPLHPLSWPKEKNVRRPVASHQRFEQTMEHADQVDAQGRLRCMLALARWTGRRVSAICRLRASDILLSERAVVDVLASMGMDESRAEHMPHGAIRWRKENDKQGFATVTPMGSRAREAVGEYLRRSPRMGDAWLFPAPKDDTQPMARGVAGRWLVRAEKLAGLPKLKGGRWHPYRRLWASERKHLPDVDVAAAGGWRDTRALKMSYQHTDPATQLTVVEAGG